MTHVIRTRAASESAPATKTTIDASGLIQLFEARKRAAASSARNGQLGQSYVHDQTSTSGFDPKLVERLAQRYNSPSIGRENTLTMADGEKRKYMEAIWAD